jgi:ABC-2 type transport system ATP-binding protein
MTGNALEIMNVTKRYGKATVLHNVSASFEAGKIHGIIGRNGSGKSVLFKCICGFTPIDLGQIAVMGRHVSGSAAPSEIGAVIEAPGFINSVSGLENLRLLASINKKADEARIQEVLELVGLLNQSKKRVSKYSMGMKQRLGIAQAIMEDPEVIILDEPMNGLDKSGVEEIRRLMLRLKERGKTILLASHNSEDISTLCDTVCEMDNGHLERLS